MSKHENLAITVSTAVLTVLLLVTGLIQGWPTWLFWLFPGLIPIAAAVLLARTIQWKQEQNRMRQQYQNALRPPRPAPEPEPPGQEILSGVSLRSAVPDYRFLLSGTVYWIPNRNAPERARGDFGALARDAIVSRAAEILVAAQPDEHSMLTERVNAVLATALPVPPGQIEAWSSDLSVTLPEADRKRLYRLAEVRKEEEVWEHERNHERNVREYLGDDVLRNPGRAVVWWLARHNDEDDSGLRTTVANIDNLHTLTSAAHATDVPEWKYEPATPEPAAHAWAPPVGAVPEYTFSAPGGNASGSPTFVIDSGTTTGNEESANDRLLAFVDEAVADRGDDEADMFVRRLALLLDTHGQQDAATELRRHFNAASYTAEEPTTPRPEDQHFSDETSSSADRPHSHGPNEDGQV